MLILVVDDDRAVRNSLKELLKEDHEVVLCEDGAAASALLEKTAVDLIISDNLMPQMTGMELLKKAKSLYSTTSFVLMTAHGSIEQAVNAIREGADDYLAKPFDLAEVEHRVRRIEDLRSWKIESALKQEAGHGVDRLVGTSPAIRQAKEFIAKVAGEFLPVLILGPSGSGKEVIAKAIHESGPRASRPVIAVNCASLSEQLMDSELFGHEKGAFTGATTSKPGKFELAKGGTLFLDEIGELSPALQAKLLRVLQEKEFYRVGGVRQIKSDARIIAATHRPLKDMVASGSFREDLFFRLNVLTFNLPPLSERKEDIPLLIEAFWKKLSSERGKRLSIAAETLKRLNTYSFPGNVRELQNVLERLMVFGNPNGEVTPDALPPEINGAGPISKTGPVSFENKGLGAFVEELESRLISEAMKQASQNQAKAAEILQISRGSLQYKLKQYGLNLRDPA